ncbi:hypothetical protein AURDEDRAFT_126959 [Auricularia subglabra TFB-10046 SS5]|nr:hypothetical protein AURDEDRAFT_126959 [Auricularia subglabra TFB-10046 SS5]
MDLTPKHAQPSSTPDGTIVFHHGHFVPMHNVQMTETRDAFLAQVNSTAFGPSEILIENPRKNPVIKIIIFASVFALVLYGMWELYADVEQSIAPETAKRALGELNAIWTRAINRL